MKIGILTYYRSHNYGAMLQAVALRTVLHDMGHQTTFIDYWPQHQKNIYRLFAWENFWRGGLRGRLGYLKSFVRTLIPKLMRRRNFHHFYHDQIAPYVSSQKDDYDVIVYGSDQIWRKQGWGYGYNPVYFGKNDFKARKHISYAASIGSLPDNVGDIRVVIENVKNISQISVREKNLQSFLMDHGIRNVSQTIDPTFLLTMKQWTTFIKQPKIVSEPYLLLYDLQGNCFNDDDIQSFALRYGWKIIRLRGSASNRPSYADRTTDGTYEFLNLVSNASFVVTSSFHGLAFSVIFHKPFWASLVWNKSRLESLLSYLGLSDRLLPPQAPLSDLPLSEIDWEHKEKLLNSLRGDSYRFLNDSLKGVC